VFSIEFRFMTFCLLFFCTSSLVVNDVNTCTTIFFSFVNPSLTFFSRQSTNLDTFSDGNCYKDCACIFIMIFSNWQPNSLLCKLIEITLWPRWLNHRDRSVYYDLYGLNQPNWIGVRFLWRYFGLLQGHQGC